MHPAWHGASTPENLILFLREPFALDRTGKSHEA
jgi:hypothetical protein